MKVEKKTITRTDGRKLTYYHFDQSATPAQQAAFGSVNEPIEVVPAVRSANNKQEAGNV